MLDVPPEALHGAGGADDAAARLQESLRCVCIQLGGMTVGILDMWREAHGAVLRKEYEDVMARMRDANPPAKAAFLNNVHQTIDHVIGFYSSASVPGRKAFLKKMREASLKMWNSGDWPSALGLGISCLNTESRFVSGDDASYVKLETDRIIKEAAEAA